MCLDKVYVLIHEYEWCGRDETKYIGAFASEAEAEAAIEKLKEQPGFCHFPDDFEIYESTLGKLDWQEGFCILLAVFVPSISDPQKKYMVEASWHPDDICELVDLYDEDTDINDYMFKLGDYVKCDECEVGGVKRCLVAKEKVDYSL